MRTSLRNRHNRAIRLHVVALALAAFAVSALAIQIRAAGPPQSFDPASLPIGFTQELYGASLVDDGQGLFGGVAFKGLDPVVAECLFSGTKLHQFDHATTEAHPTGAAPATQPLHRETLRSFTADLRGFGGCGLVNHPNGKIYANLDPSVGGRFPDAPATGVAEIDPTTWTVVRYFGPRGSALGIAVDPVSNHLVYIGQDCEQGGTATTCTLWDVDPAAPGDGDPHVFLQTSASDLAFVDGVYFTNTGDFAFLAGRVPSDGLTVVTVGNDPADPENRIGTIVPNPAADSMAMPPIPAVPSIPMTSPPDGIAFHAGPDNFIVTTNTDGTLTRFDFPGGYGHLISASQSVFASGGFRGDLTQVGPDGCIYVTQSAPDPSGTTETFGTRYDDGSTTTETSLVRICEPNGPGFVPTAAVEAMAAHLKLVKTVIGGTATATDFTLSAAGPMAVSGAGGAESDVKVGTYELSETSLPGYTAGDWSCVVGVETRSGSSITLGLGQSATCTITNTYQSAAHLTLVKVVVNDNGGTAVATDFTLSAAGTTPISGPGGVSQDVTPGSYLLSETSVPSYAASGWSCTGATLTGSSVTLVAGQSATCTITNDDQPAHLTLTKVVLNNNGGTAVATNFTLSAAGPTPISGAGGVSQDVSVGSYTLSETTKPGYAATAWSCTGGTQTGSTVALALGQSATCTITNDDLPGTVSGYAYVDSIRNSVRDAGEAGLGGVLITLSNGATTTTAADGSYTFTNVSIGSYTVSAPGAASGYTLGTPSPLGVTVSPGQITANVNFGYIAPVATPGLTVTKSANTSTYFYVGQVIIYTYVVKNTGSVSLSGPFMIADDKLGTFQCGAAVMLAVNGSVSCTRNYTIQASDLGNVAQLPSGVVATIYTGDWLQGVLSTQDTTITGAGPAVPDGVYPGWCIQDHVPTDLHNQPATLYSTANVAALPADVRNRPWGRVNWILNHKIRGAGKNDLAFFKDVQTAVWVSLGETNPSFGISAVARAMINDGLAHASFTPGPTDTVAVIIYSDGMTVTPTSIQESIIELRPLQSITNRATASGKQGSTTVTSPQVQLTVTQVLQNVPTPSGTAGQAPAVDKMTYSDGQGRRTTPPVALSVGSQVILALVASDGPTSGGQTIAITSSPALTWTLVKRANTQLGTAEIWKAIGPASLTSPVNLTVTATQSKGGGAYHQSLNVVTFTGATGVGTCSGCKGGALNGAPQVQLSTTKANSLVFGIGNDWDTAVARTIGPNQIMMHQWVDSSVGDTFWMQAWANGVPTVGTLVKINDTAPTNDRWNLAIVEVVK